MLPVYYPPLSSFLSPVGFLMMALSIGVGIYGFTMDVSSSIDEIVSMQLLVRQICLVLISIGLFIAGIVLVGCGQITEMQKRALKE